MSILSPICLKCQERAAGTCPGLDDVSIEQCPDYRPRTYDDDVRAFLTGLIANRPFWGPARFQEAMEEAERLLWRGGWNGKLLGDGGSSGGGKRADSGSVRNAGLH